MKKVTGEYTSNYESQKQLRANLNAFFDIRNGHCCLIKLRFKINNRVNTLHRIWNYIYTKINLLPASNLPILVFHYNTTKILFIYHTR